MVMCNICHKEEGRGKKNICRHCWRKDHDAKNWDKISKQQHDKYFSNREKCLQQSRDWQKKNLKRIIQQHITYYHANPERWMLRAKTIKLYGHLLKGAVCQICKIEGEKLQFHHTTEPYQIDKFMIVCRSCHKQIHSKFGKLKQFYPFDKQGVTK